MSQKIIIIPGNSDSHVKSDHWYAWAKKVLSEHNFHVIAKDMPDPEIAHMHIWLPFIETKLKADKNTIIIGHSSGAVATLRYLETHQLMGAVIIGANYTDLSDPLEKEAGYYTAPWHWDKIKKNAGWIVQFCSQDDPYIPIKEPRFIHKHLDSEYHEYTDRSHFGDEFKQVTAFPELIETIILKTSRS